MYAKLWVLTHTFCGAVPFGAEKVRCPKMHFGTKNVYPAPAGPPVFRDLKKSIPSFFVLCYNAFLAPVLVRRTQNAGEDAIKNIGIRKGELLKLVTLVQRKIEKGDTVDKIADDLLEDQEIIEKIYNLIRKYPDKDEKEICNFLI